MRIAGALVIAALLPNAVLASTVTRARYAMGTVCEITASSESQIEAAFAEARRVEAMLSTWRDDSDLARLNRGELAQPSPELEALLTTAMQWSSETNGAFDPRIRSLIDAWQTRGGGAVPSREQLAKAMQQHVWEEGAFGKGYALDRMLERIEGDAVLNFGGQLAVRGTATVTIADPSHRERPVVAFTLTNGSLSTSSGSEKTFTAHGRRFSHLIDPRSGEALPPRGSVSVVHGSALVADILSTALYVMGPVDGLQWARAHSVTAIFIDETNVIESSAPLPGLEVLDKNFKSRGTH
jgi:thiamine biosynthesis lipoprotein